ncbi:HNH endonuclease family protein, partial [Halorhabdus salina]|uniref:HNH endonuclease family protein n=1 Tax=Halorhabdus salina TaxID=2750670 RepID=UPI0015EFA702
WYPYLTNRDKFAEKYFDPDQGHDSAINESVRKIQLIFLHAGSQSATTPILFAVAEKFGVQSSEFADIVNELEKLVFRYSLVMSHGAQGYHNALSSIANDLYWSDVKPERVEKVFNSDNQRYAGYQSKELGIKEAIDRIREKRDRIAPIEEVVSDFFSTPDVLDGSFTSGWGGVRNNEVVKYVMYEYERSLRGPSGLLSLAPYHEFRKNFHVEHLVPKNAEEGNKLENHIENRNRIGNLAVLSAGENQSEGNSSFESKYDNIYSKSSLKVLRDLNGPEFSSEKVDSRDENLLKFISERWG